MLELIYYKYIFTVFISIVHIQLKKDFVYTYK